MPEVLVTLALLRESRDRKYVYKKNEQKLPHDFSTTPEVMLEGTREFKGESHSL